MKHLIAFCLVALFQASLALAEPVPVQSGEHANFSRIVTPLRDADWTVVHDNSEVIVAYDGITDGFETAAVFDLIPRDRVQEIRSDSNTLTLTLACDCAVSASIEQGNYLVIDVANSPTELEQPKNIVPRKVTASATPQPKAKPEIEQSLWPNSQSTVRNGNFTLPLETVPKANPALVTALQERLATELRTAAQRGILSGSIEKNASTPEPAPTSKPAEPPKTPSTTDTDENLSNLRISTSRDLPKTFRDLAEITRTQGQICPPDTQLAVKDWGDLRPFPEQISAARVGLFGERDQLEPKVALKLAQNYLYFGFGAEAMATLRLDDRVYKKNAHLVAIAQIMDGRQLPEQNVFSGLAECAGEAAIWGFLAAPIPPKGALPEPDGALQTVNAFPFHLRALLVPKLHEVLLAYGNPAGAAQALRSLTRVNGDVPPAARVAQARGHLEEGNIEKGKTQMAEIVSKNVEESPSALIAFVDAKLKANQPISPDTVQLVDAFSQELKNTDLSAELRRINILSLAQSGQFDAAFVALNNDSKSELAEGTQAALLGKLTQNASDIVFLEHAIAQPITNITKLSLTDAKAFARRLLTLGFPAEAERVTNTLPPLPREPEKQLLIAEIHLAMGKPFQAQADLINLRGDAANRLRADAKRMSGLFDEAHDLYRQVDSPQDAAETAWLADNWRTLIEPETATFGPATTLPESPTPLTDSDGMLSRSAALLDQSGLVRQTLQDLLSAEVLVGETAE